jgi:enterobactin synthetase component D / holo-[acyl-carrier protein] synthase
VLDLVTRPSERADIRELSRAFRDVHWDRLFFSVKESAYKAWFPLTQRWLGFIDAKVTMRPENATFEVKLRQAAHTADGIVLTDFNGRWIITGGLVTTAIVKPIGGVSR